VLHVAYFLFAALAASFLSAPPATRVALFTLVSLNATMEIQTGHSLDFASISLFMFVVCLGKLTLFETHKEFERWYKVILASLIYITIYESFAPNSQIDVIGDFASSQVQI